MPADELKFELVKPVTEIVPDDKEIPDPAVNPSCIPKPVMFAFVIFNLEKSIAAPEATSAFAIVDLVANVPKPKFVLASEAVVAPVPPFASAIAVPLHTPLVMVPTPVKLEFTTLLASVVPVKVFELAAMVISALPSNETPLIAREVVNVFAVLAVPDKVPTNVVELKEVKPVTEVTVPPKVMVVDPKVVELFANWPFVIAALEAKFDVVNPVAEIVPEAIEIPEPAVSGAWKSVPEMAALTTPLPLAFNNPFTVPAPPKLLPITVPLQVPPTTLPVRLIFPEK